MKLMIVNLTYLCYCYCWGIEFHWFWVRET